MCLSVLTVGHQVKESVLYLGEFLEGKGICATLLHKPSSDCLGSAAFSPEH